MNESLKSAIGSLEEKFENMIDMQNVLKLGHDENTVKVLQQINDLGMPPLTKEDFSSIKEQAL